MCAVWSSKSISKYRGKELLPSSKQMFATEVPSGRYYLSNRLHGVTFQKTVMYTGGGCS